MHSGADIQIGDTTSLIESMDVYNAFGVLIASYGGGNRRIPMNVAAGTFVIVMNGAGMAELQKITVN